MTYRLPYRSILLIGSNSVSDLRITLAARGLEAAGYNVTVLLHEIPFFHATLHDLFIVSRPSYSICGLINTLIEAGKPVIVDMDDDFSKIPSHSPAYNILGAGARGYDGGVPGEYLQALEGTIKRVTGFTTTSPLIAEYYDRLDYHQIDNPFDDQSPHWHAPRIGPKDMISLGWAGTATHMQDFKLIYPTLRRILSERRDVRIVIGGDDAIYRMFNDLPERQKLFLPGMQYEDYPVMFRYWDILLAPLDDTPFTRRKSDIKLVEAGARGIPFVASYQPVYTKWTCNKVLGASAVALADNDGGFFPITPDDWYKAILDFVDDPVRRCHYGKTGHDKAWSERTATIYGEQWAELAEAYLP